MTFNQSQAFKLNQWRREWLMTTPEAAQQLGMDYDAYRAIEDGLTILTASAWGELAARLKAFRYTKGLSLGLPA